MRATRKAPSPNRSVPERKARIAIDKPTAAQLAWAKHEAKKAQAALPRREENQDRFMRVVYGGGGAVGGRKQFQGRLPMLRKAFENLAKTANADHYKFTYAQAAAVISAVEVEVHKLRQVFEANAKPG